MSDIDDARKRHVADLQERKELPPYPTLANYCDVALQDAQVEVDGEWHYDDAKFVAALAANGYRVVPIAASTERNAVVEECAKLCEMSADQIRLMCGEMTAQEIRTVRAVLKNRAAAIRALAIDATDDGETK